MLIGTCLLVQPLARKEKSKETNELGEVEN